jgi:DNA-binding transcriptional LysR family regulator
MRALVDRHGTVAHDERCLNRNIEISGIPAVNRSCDLNLILVFEAVWRHRQISRAAAELKTTQPTLSNALRRLRDVVEDDLFVRAGGSMVPTPFAELLAPHWCQSAAAFHRGLAVKTGFNPRTDRRIFSLVMTDIGEAVILPKLLQVCRREAPGISFRTTQMNSDQILSALRSGSVDVAVGHIPALHSGVKQQHLFETEYVVIAKRNHPALISTGKLTRQAFLAGRHAIADAAGTGHAQVERALQRNGIADRISVRVAGFLALPTIVASSDLLATVTRALALLMTDAVPLQICQHPLKLPPLKIRQFWHERFDADPGVIWLRRMLRDATRDTPHPARVAGGRPARK